ncbi:aminotransferase class I/II-fold pyridoxal phosphate-dependent enzyme [Neorhizobium lilium]|uniref:cysteine-S-conjugate beta-lyase n=1 Tax=Neorhizobium lilium TaxID=2503024 RepID=A0A3S3SU12_9HYPH|nr:aminotransferase class I/II-fold pyridoxal phosphate-dependent enzyme [Neorhizobium lilium]RWX74794.1 aminotransferase class I/II-fold pyridoxal phosphate-dependent enzyme [Neorhizobium lilium]
MTHVEELELDFLRARLSAKWATFDEHVLPSNPAEMDFATAPPIQRAMERVVAKQQYGYSPRGSDSPAVLLAEAFARRMHDKFGWADADPSRVVIVNDLVQALMASVLAFSEPDQGVVLQVPAYPAFLGIVAQSGRRLVANRMIDTGSSYILDADDFVAITTSDVKVLLLCLPQNPTGRVFGKSELAPLIQHAIDNDMVIVSDEIHADLMLDGRVHVPLAKMFPEAGDRTITLYSATKSFNIPGLRTAIMHFGSAILQERFTAKIPPFLLGTPAVPGYFATLAAWEEAGNWCDHLVEVLARNRDHMHGRFAAELPEIKIYTPEATYLLWLDCAGLPTSGVPYENFLEQAQVAGGDGRNFGAGYDRFVRLNFASSRTILDEKIDRIVRTVRANQ